ncbi:MAG: hypothetical protein AAF353_17195 [Pseudomonadota bacterium]
MRNLCIAFVFVFCAPSWAGDDKIEIVSFRCSLAIDAVFAELDRQAGNPVTAEALERIDEDTAEFVCASVSETKILVRLQSPDMTATDNKLVFTLDARTYAVTKTHYGP